MGRPKIFSDSTERQRAHRERSGNARKRVELSLSTNTSEQLRDLAAAYGLTTGQVIERLLTGLSFEQKDMLFSESENGEA